MDLKNNLDKGKQDPEYMQTDYKWRTTVNLAVVILIILLFAFAYFLIDGFDKMKKAQLCLESVSKFCQKINNP